MDTTNRRNFLGTLAVGVAGAASAAGAGGKVRMGLIGCGWYGMVDVNAAFKAGGVEVTALCDVDSANLEKSAAEVEKLQGTRPKTYKDYREMLNAGGMDAVIIGTPPQWHALQFIAALEKKLHVYCEKPLSYDVREGQAMVAAARKSDRVIQIGFQRRQSDAYRQAAAYLREGRAGNIVQVDVQIHYRAGMLDAKPQDPPATLDWDAWCGPAPKLPYSPNIGHRSWRLEATTGNGHLVDWGIHLIDATRVMLGESMPSRVQAFGGIYHLKGQITTPDTLTAQFDFARCPVVWRHRLWGSAEYTPEVSNGIFFYGDKETVFATDNRWVVIPTAKGQERQVHEVKGGNPGVQHMADFLNAVRGEKVALCTTEDAFRSTATVQLGMIAYRTGAPVRWDEKALQIVGSADAAKLLKRAYRAPYKHPFGG